MPDFLDKSLPFMMDPNAQKLLYDSYALNAEHFIRQSGARDYHLNDDAFADALMDIEQDLNIMAYRRLKQLASKGISSGKVAGIYAFRLSRAPIIQFCPGKSPHSPLDKSTNSAIALKTALDAVGFYVSDIPRPILQEMLYNLLKRHMNQETLALVIDSLRLSAKNRP